MNTYQVRNIAVLAVTILVVPGLTACSSVARLHTVQYSVPSSVELEQEKPVFREGPTDPLVRGVTQQMPEIAVELAPGPDVVSSRREFPDIWARLRAGFGMPELDSPLAERFARHFVAKRFIDRNAERVQMYLYYVADEVERRGLPAEIALLPFVESAFNPHATSPVGACGMFQIMDATGKELGLKKSVFVSQCRDIAESTRAALDLLQRLYGKFGDWHLALAAYNWGEGRVERALERNRAAGKPLDYANLRMPEETRSYVPQLQAIKNMVRDPARYGIVLPTVANHPYVVEVAIERDIDVTLAAGLAGISLEEFRTLNPSITRPVIAAAAQPRVLLPYDAGVRFLVAMREHRGAFATWTSYTVSGRENVKSLAARLGTNAELLRRVNHVPQGMRLKAGSTIVTPRHDSHAQDISPAVASHASLHFEPDVPDLMKIRVAVKKGDTMSAIAKRNGVELATLYRWNPALKNARLLAGSQIVISLPYTLCSPTAGRRVPCGKQQG